MIKDEALFNVAHFFASKGKFLSYLEYCHAEDRPVKPVYLKNTFGNWGRVIKLVKANYSDLFDEEAMKSKAQEAAEEVTRIRKESEFIEKAKRQAQAVMDAKAAKAREEYEAALRAAEEEARGLFSEAKKTLEQQRQAKAKKELNPKKGA